METALTWASRNGYMEICELLLNGGADIHHRNWVFGLYII